MSQDSSNKQAPVIQRVAPYPIAVDIVKTEGQPPYKESIVKMTDIGFLMKVDVQHFYKVGENIQLAFTLPVVNSSIRCDGKIVKTYDAIESIKDNQITKQVNKQFTVEVHFKNLEDRHKMSISSYLVKSGQKKY